MKSISLTNPASIWILLVVIAFFGACDESLDVVPKDQVNDNTLWETTENADLFLNNIYAAVPSYAGSGDPLENFSDNAINGIAGRYSASVYGNSSYTPSNGPSQWGYYNEIRKCNLFIEKVTESTLPDDWKGLRLAEVRFLRAYFYSLLALHHGGVPIITDVLDRYEQGDEIFRARNTFDETIDFITSECATIEPGLPLTAVTGRATRGAALTLKAWCELFQASPLYNTANDNAKWQKAADSYKDVMELGVYGLFSDYRTLFFEENNSNNEVIFDRVHLGGTSMANMRASNYAPTFVNGTARAFAGSNPTQELVDDYVMANGLPIDDPLSGFDPQQPYVGREQRFYDDIIYDGAEWLDDEIIMRQGVGSKNQTDLSDNNEATNTGYYWKKAIDPKYANLNNLENGANYIIFRYADVLLGYAEAQNEANGPDGSVYDAINQVRERVGLPAVESGLTQAQMRAVIHRERRVELASEDKRWYDIIRWKTAEDLLNGHMHAVSIVRENGQWVYKYVNAGGGAKVFHPEKNYVYPIPQSARDANSKLTQNPNYD
ncbi:membrane protein [Parapedobacter pyrenivorans]|uniref:Membrane protein n=1 Tax=Parapedobacter pyrenivorans TaxID=1305674 RepID=A0A917MFB6_9SPHI|nr:RagB/SusD family nutrient uptake outer membrane protein [Parapedobacter pyrenivorans]GGH03525.1 membrane protein [Parapedobacter pyrenivorans]